MICHTCGSEMKSQITDLPFKISQTAIVIIKDLPVLMCDRCGEYLLEDPVMRRVDEILDGKDPAVELEIIRFAA